MAFINQNQKLTKEIQAIAGLSELTGYPRQIAESFLPVIEVNKKFVNVVASTTAIAPTTLYTTPTGKDFYLTNAWVQVSSAAAVTGPSLITCLINGV